MVFKLGMALVITVVESGFSAAVIEAGKKAGAEGATVLQGRGTSIHENESFMGVDIHPGKEVVLMVVKKTLRKNIMREIVRASNLSTEGKGITFCVPVEELAGSPHLFKKNPKELNVAPKTKEETKTIEEKNKNPA